MTRRGRTKKEKLPFEPGLIPAPGELLVWRDGQHFDRWQDLPRTLCGQPTPMRSHSGEPVPKARLGRFASDLTPEPKSKGQGDHA